MVDLGQKKGEQVFTFFYLFKETVRYFASA